jgi:hypothetical protein
MSNKASKIPSDAFLPVPEGTRIRYQHYYVQVVPGQILIGKHNTPKVSPPVLVGTAAWLVADATGETVAEATSWVHPNDTAIKKLGRLKAHNRCIKKYLAQD